MAQVDAVAPPGAPDRPVVDREGDGVALAERHDLGAALHARALLRQHELAAGEVRAGLRQEESDLERKGEVAIEVLVQAVEIARPVPKEQRRRPGLAGIVALPQKIRMRTGVAPGVAQAPGRKRAMMSSRAPGALQSLRGVRSLTMATILARRPPDTG